MKNHSTPRFESRYFALIDILGFSKKVTETSELASPEKLQRIYAEISSELSEPRLKKQGIKAELTLFSDTIVFSTPVPMGRSAKDIAAIESTLSSFFWCIRRISTLLLHFGFLCRGCALKGDVFHGNGLVVGPAIIRAHELESKIAKYPRIVVADKLREQVMKSEDLRKFVRFADDGPMYLHVLYEFQKFVEQIKYDAGDEEKKEEAYRFIWDAHETVSRYLSEARDNPKHYRKNRWFAGYMQTEVILRRKRRGLSPWPEPFFGPQNRDEAVLAIE